MDLGVPGGGFAMGMTEGNATARTRQKRVLRFAQDDKGVLEGGLAGKEKGRCSVERRPFSGLVWIG
jgi:hypothetical protein